MRREIANDIIFAEVEAQLKQGVEVLLKAKGRSMQPYIRDGRDILALQWIDPDKIQVGQIILAKIGSVYVAHRVIQADADSLTLQGDGNISGTEHCKRSDAIGIVAAVVRNGKRIDCTTPGEIRKAARMRAPYIFYLRARGFLGRAYRKIFPRKS